MPLHTPNADTHYRRKKINALRDKSTKLGVADSLSNRRASTNMSRGGTSSKSSYSEQPRKEKNISSVKIRTSLALERVSIKKTPDFVPSSLWWKKHNIPSPQVLSSCQKSSFGDDQEPLPSNGSIGIDKSKLEPRERILKKNNDAIAKWLDRR